MSVVEPFDSYVDTSSAALNVYAGGYMRPRNG